ncbi:MAG: hypothetical protein KIT22_06680 [Verrucomicrobiae bacterium]|nr:hypothetical protein [Verrucomicrobiae bacterium]
MRQAIQKSVNRMKLMNRTNLFFRGTLFSLLPFAAAFSVGKANAQTVSYSPGTSYNIAGALTGYQTFGNQMDGMVVTAFFTSGKSESLIWTATGASSGGVTGADWSLNENGDTFGAPWNLNFSSTVSVDRLVIDAIPGHTVFDTGAGGDTPGSAGGWAFTILNGNPTPWTATYKNSVSLNNVFYGDLYGLLDIEFANGFSGSFSWVSDTDSATINSVITPTNPVPEPAQTASLVGVGLGILALGHKLRRRWQS